MYCPEGRLRLVVSRGLATALSCKPVRLLTAHRHDHLPHWPLHRAKRRERLNLPTAGGRRPAASSKLHWAPRRRTVRLLQGAARARRTWSFACAPHSCPTRIWHPQSPAGPAGSRSYRIQFAMFCCPAPHRAAPRAPPAAPDSSLETKIDVFERFAPTSCGAPARRPQRVRAASHPREACRRPMYYSLPCTCRFSANAGR